MYARPHRSSIRSPGLWAGVQAIAVIALLLPWPVLADDGDAARSPGIADSARGRSVRIMIVAGRHLHPGENITAPRPLMSVLVAMPTSSNPGSIAAAGRPHRSAHRSCPDCWAEDWSVLADPRVPKQPSDSLKDMLLSAYDPKTCLLVWWRHPGTLRSKQCGNFRVHLSNKSKLFALPLRRVRRSSYR